MYDPNYFDFEGNAPVRLGCIKCNKTIFSKTSEKPFRFLPVAEVAKLKISVIYGAGEEEMKSYVEPLVCKECSSTEIDNKKVVDCVVAGLKKEHELLGNKTEESTAWLNKVSTMREG